MEQTVTRAARRADLDAVARLHGHVAEAAFTAALWSPDRRSLLAERRGEVVGHAVAAATHAWPGGEAVLAVQAVAGDAAARAALRAQLLVEADLLGCLRVTGHDLDAEVPAPAPEAPRGERFLHLAARAATAAQQAVRDLRDAPGEARKADGSITMAADLAGQAACDVLFDGFDAVLLSEEVEDPEALRDDVTFVVVDPLDGTGNYRAGLPPWAFSAALVEAGRPVAGLVCDLTSGRRWWGLVGGGAWEDSRPLTPRAGTTVLVPTPPEGATALVPPGFRRLRCSGCTAVDLCLVASGAAAAWHDLDRSGTHVHDVAGGLAVLAAAGGVVVDPEGAHLPLRPDTVTLIRFAAAADRVTADRLVAAFRA